MQKYTRRKARVSSQPASSAGEAIERMLVERKISAKINYEVLRDLDRTTTTASSSNTTTDTDTSGVTVAEDGGRHSVADVSGSGLSEGGQEGSAGPSGWSSGALLAPRSPLVTGRRDRLPSLQSRKRALPSLARATTALPHK